MKSARPEDLGSMGESFFKMLCKSAGLIANKSDDDKGGWDFEIEHPKRDVINYSSQSYPVYRVQIKSTRTGSNDIPGNPIGSRLELCSAYYKPYASAV